MGVPAFTRWLVEKYPNVKAIVKEDRGITPCSADPNPNGFEFDHLYLDMNGIIHPCFHPDSLEYQPTAYAEVFENICVYIDLLFSIVRPRKLLYLAIDGVAPRAKINQQRTRRFRNAKDGEIAMSPPQNEEVERKLREKYERLGKKVLPMLESQVSDSNVVTPGTEFMFELSNALKSYIVKKLESDPGWKKIKVILSDATVPGEGEHKIMSFIRTLRSITGYDPNTRHCLYGEDADLIMLALATHESHFSILREDIGCVQIQKPDFDSITQNMIQRVLAEARVPDKSIELDKKPFNFQDKCRSTSMLPQQYEFLHVWILREYLELDMQIIDPPENFVYDTEQIIDDFIFMCLFMGNDFLPRLPTLDMREKGIDLLMHVYKNEFKKIGGYMVDMQRVNESHTSFIKLKRVERFILSVGCYEEKVFKKRIEVTEKIHRRILSEFENSRKNEEDEDSSDVCITDDQCPKVSSACVQQHKAIDSHSISDSDIMEMVENTKELKEQLKKSIKNKADFFKDGVLSLDKVKLSSPRWKQRYYKEKFSVEDPMEIEILRKEILQKYTEGLCWVLMYYFSGIPSWNWYYPYYYGLFASELKGLSQVKVHFQKGYPFKPFDQLMAVLPPKSAHALPEAYRYLMTSSDSNIIEYFPRDFEVDTDGKRFFWQGTCKLPFIDQEKLLSATCQLDSKIDINEAKRNVESSDCLFWRGSNSCTEVVWDYIIQHIEKSEKSRDAGHENEPINCSNFKLPASSLRAPRLLEGVQLPEKTVFEHDILETQLWHEPTGRKPSSRTYSSRCRAQPQESYRKIGMDEQFMHKNAGVGWSGTGRGNGSSFKFPESHNKTTQNQQGQNNYGRTPSSATSRGWFRQHPTSASGPAANLNRRMESLSISSPSQENIFHGRTRNYNQNGNFWTTGNALNSQSSSSRRPVSNATVATSNAGSLQFTVEGRGRGRGRGYYRQSTDTKSSSPDPNRW